MQASRSRARRYGMTPSQALLGLVVAAACGGGGGGGGGEERQLVRIDGSPGVAPLVLALADEYRSSAGAASVHVATGLGASARSRAVADRTVDIAMASHGVNPDEIQRLGLAAHEIARTAVVFAVNASVSVTNLAREQICDIYSGRTRAWQLVGGAPGGIVPFMRPATEVDAEVALEHLECLRGLQVPAHVRVHERADEMAEALASTPGAIGVTSMTYVRQSGGRIRAIALAGVAPTPENVASGVYALTRRAMLVTKAAPSPAVDAFLAFIRSEAGARVIRDNGAVPATASR
ncbi:MAG: substrate-binding domain-containing protein [Gemmatimonadaceae bacterium]